MSKNEYTIKIMALHTLYDNRKKCIKYLRKLMSASEVFLKADPTMHDVRIEQCKDLINILENQDYYYKLFEEDSSAVKQYHYLFDIYLSWVSSTKNFLMYGVPRESFHNLNEYDKQQIFRVCKYITKLAKNTMPALALIELADNFSEYTTANDFKIFRNYDLGIRSGFLSHIHTIEEMISNYPKIWMTLDLPRPYGGKCED